MSVESPIHRHSVPEVRETLRIFSNLGCIFDKIEAEGTLAELCRMFEHIFETEISFTVKGGLIRAESEASRLFQEPLHVRTVPQQHQLPAEFGADYQRYKLA